MRTTICHVWLAGVVSASSLACQDALPEVGPPPLAADSAATEICTTEPPVPDPTRASVEMFNGRPRRVFDPQSGTRTVWAATRNQWLEHRTATRQVTCSPDGDLLSEAVWVCGDAELYRCRYQGRRVTYYETGTAETIEQYDLDDLVGPFRSWWPNGIKRAAGTYTLGEEIRESWLAVFFPGGSPGAVLGREPSKKTGVWARWDPEGRLVRRTDYDQ